jgi:hypothetical protein
MDREIQEDWQVRYAAKLARPEEAVRLIPARNHPRRAWGIGGDPPM